MTPFDILAVGKHFTFSGHDPAAALKRLTAAQPPASLGDHEAGALNYRPADELILAANAALHLRAPLLLTGDPGTGKTQFAWFLKRYFGLNLYPYTVRSTSTARDLHYDFDAVGYLRTAYLARGDDPAGERRPALDPALVVRPGTADLDPRMCHIRLGPLWRAFTDQATALVLIDEIDKAPRDFPNDLLQELDKLEFPHPFSNRPEDAIRAPRERLPLVLVTSNNERRLPDAFLRRCIVHHIRMTPDLINQAVAAHGAAFPTLSQAQRDAAIERFQALRREQRLSRQPGIAELLAWLVTLARLQPPPRAQDLKAAALADLPHLHCLIKDHADLALLQGPGRR